MYNFSKMIMSLLVPEEKKQFLKYIFSYKLPAPEDVVVIMIVGVEMVVKMFLLVTLGARMGVAVRIGSTVLL